MRATEERLFELVDTWVMALGTPAAAPAAQAVQDEFGVTGAILVTDTVGFSRSVETDGILSFLARIGHIRAVVVPLVERHGGRVVKFIADDVLALFPTVDQAVAVATELCADGFGAAPDRPHSDFQLSIGIGYGPILEVQGLDLWGDEVNKAFKLGEDLAVAGEVMLTEDAFAALADPPSGYTVEEYNVAGVDLVAHVYRP